MHLLALNAFNIPLSTFFLSLNFKFKDNRQSYNVARPSVFAWREERRSGERMSRPACTSINGTKGSSREPATLHKLHKNATSPRKIEMCTSTLPRVENLQFNLINAAAEVQWTGTNEKKEFLVTELNCVRCRAWFYRNKWTLSIRFPVCGRFIYIFLVSLWKAN